MSAHARVSMSGLVRTMACPGSLQAQEQYPRDANEYAAWGTCSHEIAETCLTLQMDAHDWEGQVVKADGFEFAVDDEMIDCTDFYVQTIRERDSQQGEGFVELQVKVNDNCWGTADHVFRGPSFLEVTDLKTGFGVVEPDAAQLKGYAYAAWLGQIDRNDVAHICTRVVQPRAPHPEGPVREYWWKPADLEIWWRTEVKPKIDEALGDNPSFHAGDHCKYCKHQNNCPVFAEASALDQALSIAQLDNKQLLAELEKLALYAERKKALEKEASIRLSQGAKLGDWYLGETSKHWIWKPAAQAAAEQQYGADAFKKDLKSPAQIAKLPGGKEFKTKYAFKPAGDVKLCAPKSAAKPAPAQNAEDAFAKYMK